MAISKSAQAIAWLNEDPETRTQRQAAEMFGINESTVSNALKLRAQHPSCPCCGQIVREGNSPGRKSQA